MPTGTGRGKSAVAPRIATGWSAALRALGLVVSTSALLLAQTAPGPEAGEITTQETQPTFRIQTERNVVIVRVTVRDVKGRVVGGLRQEDFRLSERGKPQTITHFSVETTASPAPAEKAPSRPARDPEAFSDADVAPDAAKRYLALFFDDVHISFDNLVRTRDAADHYLATALQPGDRVGIFTSSGRGVLDFTDDRAKLRETLFRLRHWPVFSESSNACPNISDYQAYLIVEQREPQALQIAQEEVYVCRTSGGDMMIPRNPAQEQAEAEGYAMNVLNQSEQQALYALRGLEQLARRMALLPGQRQVVLISPGFLIRPVVEHLSAVIDRALRANVIINALDSRGLYVSEPLGDISERQITLPGRMDLMTRKNTLRMDRERTVTEALTALAGDTGGQVFENSNDFDQGLRQMGMLPGISYVLAFSPQNLKLDGSFHPLKVTLANSKGLTIQARRGYYAPRRPEDPAAQAKEEIEQALFSKDEVNELPLSVQTQFFKVNELDARLSVLTHVDLRLLRFRKEGERNLNNLTLVTALFDRDGRIVTGKQKRLDLKLRDQTLEQLLRTGLTVKTSFDIKAGTYLVREVVRDAEGGQLAGLNRTVEIPY